MSGARKIGFIPLNEDGTSYERYNLFGQLVESRDAEAKIYKEFYPDTGKLKYIRSPDSTTIEYDESGNITSMRDAEGAGVPKRLWPVSVRMPCLQRDGSIRLEDIRNKLRCDLVVPVKKSWAQVVSSK